MPDSGLLWEFWVAIHDLWRWQHDLGLAVSNHASQKIINRLDTQLHSAMVRVEVIDNMLNAGRR